MEEIIHLYIQSLTHTALYPGHKIYTLARNHRYRYRYIYLCAIFSCVIKISVMSLTY